MIRQNADIETVTLPGIAHQTLAGPRDGLKAMEMWSQTLSPGAGTPVHRHACEEIIFVLSGQGECEIDGDLRSFNDGATLIIPPDAVHRIANTGPSEMRLVAALSAAPVRVHAPDGTRILLPWDS